MHHIVDLNTAPPHPYNTSDLPTSEIHPPTRKNRAIQTSLPVTLVWTAPHIHNSQHTGNDSDLPERTTHKRTSQHPCPLNPANKAKRKRTTHHTVNEPTKRPRLIAHPKAPPEPAPTCTTPTEHSNHTTHRITTSIHQLHYPVNTSGDPSSTLARPAAYD